MRLVKTTARNIKEAGKRRRVSVRGSTCSKTQHANRFFSESEMCFDSKSRQERGIERKKESGRNMNNLKWNWGGNSTESYNAVCSSCAACFVIAVSFEPSLICPPSMTPSTRLNRGGQQTSKVKSTCS